MSLGGAIGGVIGGVAGFGFGGPGGAAAGAAGGVYLGNMFFPGGRGGVGISQVSGHSGAQQSLMRRISKQTEEQLGRYQPTLDRLASGDPSTDVNEGISREFVQRSIADPAMARLREQTIPMLNQRFGGGRGFWGSARARATQKSVQDTQNQISSQLGQTLYQDEQSRRALAESGLQRALQAQQFSPEQRAAQLLGMKPVDTIAVPPTSTIWDQLGIGMG